MGVLDRGERDKDNEIGLKEGGGIEMSTTVLHIRDARSPSLKILTNKLNHLNFDRWMVPFHCVEYR